MPPTVDALRTRMREVHGMSVARLRQCISADLANACGVGSTFTYLPATMSVPSILDSAVEVHLTIAAVPLVQLSEFVGCYPSRSHMVAVSVGGRDSRTGRVAVLTADEVDAWGTITAPSDFYDYVVRLGVLAASTSHTVHYRYILGADLEMCVLDPGDHTILKRNHSYS